MKLLHKIQEKMADRFSFVQYPNIRPADNHTKEASRTGLHFTHQMPLGERLDLFLMSLALFAFGLMGLAVACFVLYVVLF